MPAVRRLAAILAADVAGYSRLMGADEEGTHERLKAHRREFIDPKISEHSGRIVKTTGDGMLAEFPSVVDAVRCAAEVQRAMIDREAGIPEDRRIRFRVGINLGDVIVDGDDIFGDGVNVAARLEALAEPGGICISRMVRDQIRDKLAYTFEDLGEQNVKNIARPVRVYALRPEAVADLPASMPPKPRQRRSTNVVIAAVAPVALVIAVSAWWLWPAAKPSATSAVAAATSIAPSLVAPRLSIVVLPFANLGNDPDQQYFADGITEDLTTDLYADRRHVRDLAEYRLHLSGQAGRHEADRPRAGGALCAGRQHSAIERPCTSQRPADRCCRRRAFVGRAVRRRRGGFGRTAERDHEPHRGRAQSRAARGGGSPAVERPDVQEYILRGRAQWNNPPAPENYLRVISFLEHALALDPRSVDAQSWLAAALAGRVLNGMSDTRAPDIERAEGLVRQALAASPHSPVAHLAKGQVLRAQNRCAEAIPEYETVLAFNRNWPLAIASLGWCKFLTGSLDQAIPVHEQAIRLSPRDPLVGVWYQRIGQVHLLQSRTDEAIAWLERARNANPGHPDPHAWLASAYAIKGDTERAAAELAEARRLDRDDRYSSLARLKAVSGVVLPKVRALSEATFVAGLRLAGMPEE
jgi:adenylate cyclase